MNDAMNVSNPVPEQNRREFLKLGALAGLGLTLGTAAVSLQGALRSSRCPSRRWTASASVLSASGAWVRTM